MKTPSLHTQKFRLRVLGTNVTLIDEIKKTAEADLGIELEFIVLDGIEAQRRGALSPETFDIYDQWFHDLDLVWPARSLKPIDSERINSWEEFLAWPVLRTPANSAALSGTPLDRLYVQDTGELSRVVTQRISMLPTVYNADSFAIVGDTSMSTPESWADLLSERWHGRVAIQADAAIGAVDLLLALRARNEIICNDPGNLSLNEIGTFIRLIKQYQLSGHFAGFWTDKAPTADGGARLSTMWWSNFLSQKARGAAIRMCSPQEGYRGWCGGMALSNNLDKRTEEAAYAYMNWWLSGPAGAIMARNGAYMAAPKATQSNLTANEWDFWYNGQAATSDIFDPFGNTVYRPGEIREGGSCREKQKKIVNWNSVMDEHNFLVRLWNVITQDALI